MKSTKNLSFATLLLAVTTLSLSAQAATNGKKPKNCNLSVPQEIVVPEARFTYDNENGQYYTNRGATYRNNALQNLTSQCNSAILGKPEQERTRYSCGDATFGMATDSWMNLLYHKALTAEEMTSALCGKLTACMAIAAQEKDPTEALTWVTSMRSAIGCTR